MRNVLGQRRKVLDLLAIPDLQGRRVWDERKFAQSHVPRVVEGLKVVVLHLE